MGWKEDTPLGTRPQALSEPLPLFVKYGPGGVGKDAQDAKYIAPVNMKVLIPRKLRHEDGALGDLKQEEEERVEGDGVELTYPPSEQEILNRSIPTAADGQHGGANASSSGGGLDGQAAPPPKFTCELCNKEYLMVHQWEAHLSSYDHHHRKRLLEMKQMESAMRHGHRSSSKPAGGSDQATTATKPKTKAKRKQRPEESAEDVALQKRMKAAEEAQQHAAHHSFGPQASLSSITLPQQPLPPPPPPPDAPVSAPSTTSVSAGRAPISFSFAKKPKQ